MAEWIKKNQNSRGWASPSFHILAGWWDTLLALGGIAIFDQIQNFIKFLQSSLVVITKFFNDLPSTVVDIGPFTLDFSYINWDEVGNQLLSTVEPVLSNLGNVIGGVASGAANFFSSLFLSMVVSFLLLNESGGSRHKLFSFNIPGYEHDFGILGEKINTIWSAFLRGQGIVYLLRFVMYLVILSVFQVRFLLGMAIVATIGNFIPYIGVAISWITIFLVALLQGTRLRVGAPDLRPIVRVGGEAGFTDPLQPRFMWMVGQCTRPVGGMLVGLNLCGFWARWLAAPILATLKRC